MVRARPWNHTGPGQSDAYVASSFARQLAEMALGRREPVLRVGNLDAVRDFLDVADVVDAYVRLLDPRVPRRRLQRRERRPDEIAQLLELLVEHARLRPAVEVDPARASAPIARRSATPRSCARATGWSPRIPLDDTLARLFDAWRDRLSATP